MSKIVNLNSSNDLNTDCYQSGFYCWASVSGKRPANKPTGNGTEYLDMLQVTGSGSACFQELCDVSDSSSAGIKMQRTIYGSNFITPWEWINPPMAVGAEYRTTERYMGLPVYTILIDCGDASDGKQIDISNVNASIVIRSESITDGWAPLPVIGDAVYCNTIVVPHLITVRCSELYVGTSLYCRLSYIKRAG